MRIMKGVKEMSRFLRPELEVVRFTEEDVIVASGLPKLSVTGANNTAPSDLVLSLGSYRFEHTAGSNPSSFYSNLTDLFGSTIDGETQLYNKTTGDMPSISEIITRDNSHKDIELTGIDGSYVWVPADDDRRGYFMQ